VPEFELFTKRMVPLTRTPSVTIGKRGTLSLNKAAFASMGEPEAVELLFAKEERIIGIRPASGGEPHAYKVHKNRRDDGPFLVTGTSFCKYYGINLDVSRRWKPTLDGSMMTIDLNGEGTEVRGNRNGSQREGAEAEAG